MSRVEAASRATDAVRAEWAARQGLGACATALDAVRHAGWMYQTGGSGAYLSLRARVPNLRRADVDAAVASGELVILTGVRGCTFLVPAEEGALARAAWGQRVDPSVEEVVALGVDREPFARLMDEIEVAAQQPREPAVLRPECSSIQRIALPKYGLSNTFPLALRVMEARGRLTRLPATGRLDSERYAWRRTDRASVLPASDDALLRRFLSWNSPASTPGVADWFGSTQGAVRERLSAFGAIETPEGWRIEEGGTTGSPSEPAPTPAASDAVHFLPFRDPLPDGRSPPWFRPPTTP